MTALVKKNIAAESKLDEIEARLEDLTAQRNEAQLSLDRTRITAPISGRLNEIKAKEGDLLDVNQQVARILQFEKVKVMVGVPESDVAAVFDLNEAEVIIEALGNRRVQGKKVFLSRQPRTLARLYDLELMVLNPDGRILPGMFAQVELIKKVFDQALAVPLYAVITQGDERFVYVEKDGQAEKRLIKLGVLVGWQVHVEAGLSPGERVIVVGHRFLDAGQAVKVIKNVSHPSEILAS
jgi:membrane fusion protein (multidrug efflux system)